MDGAGSQVDSSLILGGYDAAKISGPSYSILLQPTTGQCQGGMYVNILDMSLGLSNGTVSSLIAGSSAPGPFATCLEPDYPYVMSIAESPYYDNFGSMTETSYLGREPELGFAFWGLLYEPSNVYGLENRFCGHV